MYSIYSALSTSIRLLVFSVVTICYMGPTVVLADAFGIERINISGLHGLSQEAVMNQLPVKVGDQFDIARSDQLIKTLYATQWFDDVVLSREGNQLIVSVTERPTLSRIVFKGDHGIPKEALEKMLQRPGLIVGDFFDAAALNTLKQELLSQYTVQGNYEATVETKIIEKDTGIVEVMVNIHPKTTSQFVKIRLIGNRIFSEKDILNTLPISAARTGTVNYLLSLLQQKSVTYNYANRASLLESLIAFYHNRGYHDFAVLSDQLYISADQSEASWILEVTEGPQYKVSHYRILGNRYGLKDSELSKLIHFKVGQTYSAKEVSETKTAITDYFTDAGYLNTTVQITPSAQRHTREIALVIQISRGQQCLVRNIDIVGNQYIQDRLLRGRILQNEGGLASAKDIKASERNLLYSQLATQANIHILPVEGVKDHVDLLVNIQEPARKFTPVNPSIHWGAGGLCFEVNSTLENILGNGKDVNFRIGKDVINKFNKEKNSNLVLELGYKNNFAHLFGLHDVKYALSSQFTDRNLNPGMDTLKNTFMQSNYTRGLTDHMFVTKEVLKSMFSDSGYARSIKDHTFPIIQFTKEIYRKIFPNEQKNSQIIEKQIKKEDVKEDAEDIEVKRSQFDFDLRKINMAIELPASYLGDSWNIDIGFISRHFYLPEEKLQAKEIKHFFSQFGNQADQYVLRISRYRNNIIGIFPIKGSMSNLSFCLALSGLSKHKTGASNKTQLTNQLSMFNIWSGKQPLHYLKIDYQGSRFWNLTPNNRLRQQVFGISWQAGIGYCLSGHQSQLPFFDNYHSARVLGYKDDALGAKDSVGNALGGSVFLKAQAMYFLPKPLSSNFLDIANVKLPYRSSIFLNAANVYDDVQSIYRVLKDKRRLPITVNMGIALEMLIKVPFFGAGGLPVFTSYTIPVIDTEDAIYKQNFTFGVGLISS